MDSDLRNVILIFFGVVISLFLLSVMGGAMLQYNSCNNFTELTGNDCRWHIFDMSYVNIEGEWIRYDLYKAERTAAVLRGDN